MARNRQRVYGRGKFTAFLKGLVCGDQRTSWDLHDDSQRVYVRFRDSSCPNHPKIILRSAGFGILCENRDYEKCWSQQQAWCDLESKPEVEPRCIYCDHFMFSVEEYVKECSGSRHVIGTRIREEFGMRLTEEL